ncbi:MAG: UDP-N-acetylmuramoyl-tripeptide--D-alanyl-D-alanine ligase, partial [Planctomycetes bacterium]|nr:UDP-N-acetylmuramoyl-tripeptide--D-alanyl-D-alanine ligase [Planctomycetota bacterium]
MRPRGLEEIVRTLEGSWLGPASVPTRISGATIDSRRVRPGDLFFALAGEHVHGVSFARTAHEAGAVATVCDRAAVALLRAQGFDGGSIVVADAAVALAKLAESVRREEAESLPAAAVTGSVGKTTTCGYAAQLLESCGVVHRPPSSYNNHLGVPLTVLNAPPECDYLIAEVGTSAPGEVYRYATWVRPRVAVVTAVAPAHLQGLADLEHIELEKLSILETLDGDGAGWIPRALAEKHASLLRNLSSQVRTFGPGGDLEIRSNAILGTEHELILRDGSELRTRFEWRAPFPHSIRNLECALAVGMSLGVDLRRLIEGVERLDSPPLRGETVRHGGVDFVLDCYNANPASMESAIERLENEPTRGRRICVVGTMEELGAQEQHWHRRLGGRLASAKLDRVFVIGRGREWYAEAMTERGIEPQRISDDEDSVELLASQLEPG